MKLVLHEAVKKNLVEKYLQPVKCKKGGQRKFFLMTLNSYWAGIITLRNKNLTLFKILYF
jgi:hypothetical protein